MRFRSQAAHAVPVSLFVLAVAIWMSPLLQHMEGAIPGEGAGDNLTFVWNSWWMRYALAEPGVTFWHCPLLFHPFGVGLVLHTHTAFEAAVSAVFLPAWSVVRSQNAWILAHLFLNFICAYALAWRTFRSSLAATVAAVAFGFSPYVSAHLLGHFNLLAAWILPLSVLLAEVAVTGRFSVARAVPLGVALGAAAYLDYYYTIYAVLLVVFLLALETSSVQAQMPRRRSRLRRTVLLALLVLLLGDVLLIGWIATSGGGEFFLGNLRVSARGAENPISIAGGLLLIGALVWFTPSRVRVRVDSNRVAVVLRSASIAAVTTVVLIAPLAWRAVSIVLRGEYVSQPYFWRSAPSGIDAATLVLGNPFSALFGSHAQRLYSHLGIDKIEQVAWLGPGVLVLAAVAIARGRRSPLVRTWVWSAVPFALWALGPRLAAFGADTHLLLPAIGVRYIPIVANARIPGRAMIVVYLAGAMLAAAGFHRLWQARGSHRVWAAALGALVLIDYWPIAPPLYEIETSSVFEAIRASREPGAVCELPLALRDGFGEIGPFDSRVLMNQTVHRRPIVGGFVARLNPRITASYKEMPIVGSLLRLSSGGRIEDEDVEADRMRAGSVLAEAGIGFVVVDKRRSPPALLHYVKRVMPLQAIAEDGERLAYVVARE